MLNSTLLLFFMVTHASYICQYIFICFYSFFKALALGSDISGSNGRAVVDKIISSLLCFVLHPISAIWTIGFTLTQFLKPLPMFSWPIDLNILMWVTDLEPALRLWVPRCSMSLLEYAKILYIHVNIVRGDSFCLHTCWHYPS